MVLFFHTDLGYPKLAKNQHTQKTLLYFLNRHDVAKTELGHDFITYTGSSPNAIFGTAKVELNKFLLAQIYSTSVNFTKYTIRSS